MRLIFTILLYFLAESLIKTEPKFTKNGVQSNRRLKPPLTLGKSETQKNVGTSPFMPPICYAPPPSYRARALT